MGRGGDRKYQNTPRYKLHYTWPLHGIYHFCSSLVLIKTVATRFRSTQWVNQSALGRATRSSKWDKIWTHLLHKLDILRHTLWLFLQTSRRFCRLLSLTIYVMSSHSRIFLFFSNRDNICFWDVGDNLPRLLFAVDRHSWSNIRLETLHNSSIKSHVTTIFLSCPLFRTTSRTVWFFHDTNI